MKPTKEFIAFALIGISNTITHALILILLIEKFSLNPTVSNTIAFIFTNTISFFLNSHLTFKTTLSLKRYSRFISSSLLALSLTISLSLLAEFMKWHYLIGLALIIIITPPFTFMLQKHYTFKKALR